MVYYRSPKKGEYFAMIRKDEIFNQNLTDFEFRLYTYYLSHDESYTISLSKTVQHFNGIKSKRTIEEAHKSLVRKGFVVVRGKRDAKYYIGEDIVTLCYEDHQTYFDDKKKKSNALSEKMKSKSKLTKENRLIGSRKKVE